MATSRVDYGNISLNGWDRNNWFYGLPNIGAHSTLTSVILHFPYVRRDGGAANGGKLSVEISGSTLTVSNISRNTDYRNLTLNITNYVSYNSSGEIYFKSGTYLNIKLYHNQVFIGSQSDWTLTGIYVEATYTQGSHSYTSSSVIVNPTCTTAGTRRHYCSCGASTDETIPALGHNYVATNTILPSGNNAGYTVYTCSNGCGGSYIGNYTNSISVKAGTGCSYVSLDGAETIYEGATRDFVLLQTSGFTLYSFPKEGYEFDRWNIVNADGSVSTSTVQHLPVTLNNNVSVEAIYKRITYTATFLNGDGSVLETVTVAHGDTPVCSKTPTKASTEGYSYTWDEANPWTPAIGALTGNQTYTPNFIEKKNSYEVIFKINTTDTEPFDVITVEHGEKLPYIPVAPDMEDEKYIYEFWGWSSHNNWATLTEDTQFFGPDIYIARYSTTRKPPQFKSVTITRSSDLAQVTINTPVDAESKFIISVEVI